MSDEKIESASPTMEANRPLCKGCGIIGRPTLPNGYCIECSICNAPLRDAALAAARAENDQIRDLHRLASASCAQIERERDEARQQLAALSAANAGLRKALEPFANDADDESTDYDPRMCTAKELRDARDALLAAPAPEPVDERDKRIEELEAALKPFVEYVSTSRFEGRPDHWRVGFGELTAGFIIGKGPTPTLGDCRRAAELLKPTSQPRPE